MSGVATAIVATAVIGSQASKSAANTAASATENAANTASASQERMFNKQVELQEPWRQAGINALNQLGTGFNGKVDLTEDPGYQFRLSEGLKALNRQQAAGGNLLSGGALKAAARYGQDYASNEYQNAYNRALTKYNTTAALAGVGQTATNALSGAASNYGNNLANLQYGAGTSAGAARASGYMGTANALTGALNTGLNYYQNQALLNRLMPQQTAGATYPSMAVDPYANIG